MSTNRATLRLTHGRYLVTAVPRSSFGWEYRPSALRQLVDLPAGRTRQLREMYELWPIFEPSSAKWVAVSSESPDGPALDATNISCAAGRSVWRLGQRKG